MRVVALDVGTRRIGLAAGDSESGLAFGRGYLLRTTLAADLIAIRSLLSEEGAQVLCLGLPRKLSGAAGTVWGEVEPLAQALSGEIKIELVDERFTTRLAQNRLRGASRKARREKGNYDEGAAIAILETYLELIRGRD